MEKINNMLQAIGRTLHSNFKREFLALAMDPEDVIQDSFLYYLDFKKRFEKKFRKEILWSAIKQYVTWKILEKVYHFKKKNVSLVSLDDKINDSEFTEYDNDINKALLKITPKKLFPFKNDKDLIKIILKNDTLLFNTLKEMLGERKYEIFMDVLINNETKVSIGRRRNLSGEYVGQVYKEGLSRLKYHLA